MSAETTSKKWFFGPLILIGAISVFLVGVVSYVGSVEILLTVYFRLTEDTEFAPGYSESAFQSIEIGDSEETVRAALGNPLSETIEEPHVSWLYAPHTVPEFEANGDYPGSEVSFTTITFGEAGYVIDVFGQISHGTSTNFFTVSGSSSVGDGMNTLSISDAEIDKLKNEKATPEEIEAKYGNPVAIFESCVVKWLDYSHSPGSHNYLMRDIGIDRDEKVCQKESEIYWD